jgi:transposase
MPTSSAEEAIKDIRRAMRRHWSAEDKKSGSCWKACGVRRASPNSAAAKGLQPPSTTVGRKARSPGSFMEAGKRRLAGDTARAATFDEVKDLRRESQALKEVVADLTLENRLLKKSMIADGEDEV